MTFTVTAPDPLPRHGRYEIDGERYARVSTVLGVLAKPGLEAWKRKVGYEEAERISKAAADLGTRIHAVCEQWDIGLMADAVTAADLQDHLSAYLQWKAANVAEVVMVEETVVHKRHRYAGTLDRLVRLTDGRLMIFDLKTGKTVDGVYRLQQSAYEVALEANGVDIDGRMVLHLPASNPGAIRAIEYDDDATDRATWLALLRVWRWTVAHSSDWRTQ
jgi:hypothetical protein